MVCALEGCEETFVKRCSVCKATKCQCEFNKDKGTKDGLCYQCRACQRHYHTRWRKKNDANLHSTASRYGLGVEKLTRMLAERDGVCDACGRQADRMNVDHDHSCCSGKTSCGQCVRGLLCSTCNFALGSASDKIWRLEALISYLEAWNAR